MLNCPAPVVDATDLAALTQLVRRLAASYGRNRLTEQAADLLCH